MIGWCKSLCKKEKKGGKKKDKHGSGKDDDKKKHKMKNVQIYTITGQGKKNVEQDTFSSFELIEDGAMVKFFAVYDGHGDFGKEVNPT